MTTYRLFFDDVREPHEAFFRKKKSFKIDDWVVVRTVAEAIDYIKINGYPEYVSFDYDLEQGYTTPLAEYLIANNAIFDWDIHSTNRHGVKELKTLLDEYFQTVTEFDFL